MDLDADAGREVNRFLALRLNERLQRGMGVQESSDVAPHDARLPPVGGDDHEHAPFTGRQVIRPTRREVDRHERRDVALAGPAAHH